MVAEYITQRELRNDSGRIMRALYDGQTFVVTRRSEPVGELRPLRRHRFVDVRVALATFASAPPLDGAALRRDLDSVVDQRVDLDG